MDLAAFLTPGVHPVFLDDDLDRKEPWGHVVCRPGRPVSWLARAAQSPDASVAVKLSLPGWRLAPDGSLDPDGEDRADVSLLVHLGACRSVEGVHVLRFKSLTRLLD
jgi:hypothetical protein